MRGLTRFLLLTLFFVVVQVQAQALALTDADADIRQWAGAYQAVLQWAENNKVGSQFTVDATSAEQGDFFRQMLTQARGQANYPELAAVLRRNGYTNPQPWAVLGDRIMKAFLATHLTSDVAQQMQQAQVMLASGMVPPAYRAKLEQALSSGMRASKMAENAPAEDKIAVQRNSDVLQPLFSRSINMGLGTMFQ